LTSFIAVEKRDEDEKKETTLVEAVNIEQMLAQLGVDQLKTMVGEEISSPSEEYQSSDSDRCLGGVFDENEVFEGAASGELWSNLLDSSSSHERGENANTLSTLSSSLFTSLSIETNIFISNHRTQSSGGSGSYL